MNPSRETVVELAGRTGFDAQQLEIVVRLIGILREVGTDAFLAERLALKGGTPLNLCFGPPPRLSVDLDLNYVGSPDRDVMLAERASVLEGLERIARLSGYAIQRSSPEHAGERRYLRYRSVFDTDARIVLDVNFMYRVPLGPVQVLPLWHPVEGERALAHVVANEELVAGKLVALLARWLPRDIYDVAMIKQREELLGDGKRTRALFIAMSGMLDRPLWEYPVARLEGVSDREFRDHLHPLLREAERPEPELLRRHLRALLEPWLQLSDAEGAYVAGMQRGELSPELLFPQDPGMAAALRQHPALLWKAENARKPRRRRPRRKE